MPLRRFLGALWRVFCPAPVWDSLPQPKPVRKTPWAIAHANKRSYFRPVFPSLGAAVVRVGGGTSDGMGRSMKFSFGKLGCGRACLSRFASDLSSRGLSSTLRATRSKYVIRGMSKPYRYRRQIVANDTPYAWAIVE
jgi:hypothetical protein